MKRRDIIKKLSKAGLTFKEGGSHTAVYRGGKKVPLISGRREIAEPIVR